MSDENLIFDKEEEGENLESIGESIRESLKHPRIKRRGVFPTIADLLAIIGIFFVSQFITGLIFVMAGWSVGMPDNIADLATPLLRAAEEASGEAMFRWAIIAQPLMLALVLLYRTLRRGKWGVIHHSAKGFHPSIILWGVMMMLSIVVVIEPLMHLLPDPPVPTGRGVYMMLSLLVVAPIFEELLCRGVILEAIRSKWGVVIASILSSMIFGIMHVEPQAVLNAFIIGLLLSYIYLRSNSIFAPIILHSINNLFAYTFVIFEISDHSLYEMIDNAAIYTIIQGCSLAVLVLSAIAISRSLVRLERQERAKRREAAK